MPLRKLFSFKMISHLWSFRLNDKEDRSRWEKIPSVASHILEKFFSTFVLILPYSSISSKTFYLMSLKVSWKAISFMPGVIKRCWVGERKKIQPTKHQKWKHGKQIKQTFMIYLIFVFTFISDEKQFFLSRFCFKHALSS